MERIYYPDHDQRYAHIHPKDRWKYPDEIRIGFTRYKRDKTYAELSVGVEAPAGRVRLDAVGLLLAASDIPYTEACFDGGGWG